MSVEKELIKRFKGWISSDMDDAFKFISEAIDEIGDPYKLVEKVNHIKVKSTQDEINIIKETREKALEAVGRTYNKAVESGYGDQIKDFYQETLDKINTYMVDDVSLLENQVLGMQNQLKYKQGSNPINRHFKNLRVNAEIEIEDVWNREAVQQRARAKEFNKKYTDRYHPNIEPRFQTINESTSSFADKEVIEQYNKIKEKYPDMTITENVYGYELDVDKAHEAALKENIRQDSGWKQRERQQRQKERQQRQEYNQRIEKNRQQRATETTSPINTTAQTQAQENINNRKKRKLKNANKSYRPETIVDGNNIEFDSIYNHSVPKKINKNNNSVPEVNVNNVEPEVNVNNNVETVSSSFNPTDPSTWTNEDLDIIQRTNPEQYDELMNFYAEQRTANIPETQPQPNFDPSDPNTWTDKDIETIRQSDPDYADELEELRRNNTVNTPQPKAFDVEDPSTWTDDFLENIKNTDPDYYNELMELRNQGVPNTPNPNTPKTQSSANTPNVDPELEKARLNKERAEEAYRKAMEQINSKPDVEKIKSTKQTREFANKNANAENFAKNNFDELDDGKINKKTRYTGEYTANTKYTDNNGNIIKTRRTVKNASDAADAAKNVSKAGLVTTGINVISTIGDYKDERRKGHGMVSSAVRAGAKFAMYEALGLWSIPVALVSNVPGAVIKGADMLYKENRRMNSAANFEAFGGAQFMDTQQLATMRQSGMEMAKMANYNLQQTLMGNEATYLHR